MKFCLGRTPSAPEQKGLGVTHQGVHSLLSRESWACNDYVCVPPARYEAANSRSGILSSGSSPVVVVQHAAEPLPALHFTWVAEVARLWADETVPQALVIAFP